MTKPCVQVLKISPAYGYDMFYIPLKNEKNTWKEILDHIESALDDQYLMLGDRIDGIKMEISIEEITKEEYEELEKIDD